MKKLQTDCPNLATFFLKFDFRSKKVVNSRNQWDVIAKRYATADAFLAAHNPFSAYEKGDLVKVIAVLRTVHDIWLPTPIVSGFPVSSTFGWRTRNGVREFHYGVDIACPVGTSLYSPFSGLVYRDETKETGKSLTLIANNIVVKIFHLSHIHENDGILRGLSYIGKSGATGIVTGPHLHISVKVRGSYVDPLLYGFTLSVLQDLGGGHWNG